MGVSIPWGQEFSLWEHEKVLKMDGGDGYTTR